MKSQFIFTLTFIVALYSCSEGIIETPNLDTLATNQQHAQQMVVISPPAEIDPVDSIISIGSRLANPYKLSNMKNAIIALAQEGITPMELTVSDIYSTHLHVQFNPTSES